MHPFDCNHATKSYNRETIQLSHLRKTVPSTDFAGWEYFTTQSNASSLERRQIERIGAVFHTEHAEEKAVEGKERRTADKNCQLLDLDILDPRDFQRKRDGRECQRAV